MHGKVLNKKSIMNTLKFEDMIMSLFMDKGVHD